MTQTSPQSLRVPLLHAVECMVALFLGFAAVSYSVYCSYVYKDNQLISWAVALGAVLYTSAIGAGSRWGVAFPPVLLAAYILIAVSQDFSFHEWFCAASWAVYITVAVSLAAYFWHRRQTWLLPLATACALVALVAQLCYKPWNIWHVFDTLGLLVMLAESACRSIATLCSGSYFYTDWFRIRKNSRKLLP